MLLSKSISRRVYALIAIAVIASVFIVALNIRPLLGGSGDWWNTDWQYRKRITIDHTKVDANLTDFPVLIDITDPDLSLKVQNDGDDIVFTSENGTKLNHEIESFDEATGKLVAWVRIPNLSSITDTVLYMYYGNPSAGNQQNATGVWDSDFKMVQHLEERYPSMEAQWQKYEGNPIISALHGDPDIYYENGTYYVYNDKLWDQIDLWTSADGVNYIDQGLVLNFSASGWDSGLVRDPTIVKVGSTYHLYYAGSDDRSWPNSHHWMVGHATASSPLGPFTKDPNNPIFNLTGYGVNEPDVIYEPDATLGLKFKMTYTYASGGSGDDVGAGDIGYVHSEYANFSTYTNEGTILATTHGGVDPQDQCVIKVNNTYYMYYSVGNYQFDSANSTDFINWNYQTDAALIRSPTGFDSVSIYSPSIDYDGTKYLMVYQASDGSVWQIGLATIPSLPEQQAAWPIYDSTINRNNGTAYGVQTNTSGKIDGGDKFDGINDYTECPNLTPPSYSFTAEAWVNFDDTADNVILSGGDASGANIWYLGIWDTVGSSGKIGFGIYSSSWTFVEWSATPTTVRWYYVVGVYDHSKSKIELYVDGTLCGNTSKTYNTGTLGTFRIGRAHWHDEASHKGLIDEVRVSNTSRPAGWISACFNNQKDPSSFYWVGSEEEYGEAPSVSEENPRNGAIDVPLNPTLSVRVTDFQGDNMTIMFQTNVTGTWQDVGTYAGGNGIYDQTTSGMNSYSTKYYWKVCVTDSSHWANKTYSFTTRPENYPPSQSNPSPQDGATGVCFDPLLSIDVSDADGDLMTITFSANVTGIWQVIGTKTGGDGRYNQTTSGIDDYEMTYHWMVSVTDGKTWTNKTYSFTTWAFPAFLTEHIGYYWCAGMPYAGESKDKDTFFMIWFAKEYIYPWPPHGYVPLWYAEFNKKTGWVNGTVLYMSWLCNWGEVSEHTGCPHFGYFDDKYYVFHSFLDGYLWYYSASDWSDFQSMSGGWTRLSDYLGNIEPWGSVYAFNNSYAITFYTKDYPTQGHTIVYWIWNETSGWSSPSGIPIWSTSTGGHEYYPHDCSGAALLPINRTTWYLYYKSDPYLYIVKSFDAGNTWGTPQIVMPISWRNHRSSFVRYGDNFYMIVNVGGSDISCYNSTDGLHWGNRQIMSSLNVYVPQGVMLDQSHILWTVSELGYSVESTGDMFGGVFKIPKMIANPGKPSDPYPSNGALLPEGTTTTSLRVKVHGDQTYDVAFYWANGTFIGEDKLLQEDDIATVEVSGLKNGKTYEWYAISRGATYGYWGNEPDTTSDENRSDTFSFAIGVEPKLNMNPSNVTCRKYSEQFTIQINLTDVINVNDFAFEIHYNTTLLDYLNLTWGIFLDGTKVIDKINETLGIIQGHIETSTPASGTGWLLNITFHVNKTIIWKDGPSWVNKLEDAIRFHWAELSYPGGIYMRYEEWPGGRREITVNQVRYIFVPIQGDVDNDGDVDIFDLRATATYYNAKEGDPLWPTASTYDLNCDGIIDIYDLVRIAVKYGETYDC